MDRRYDARQRAGRTLVQTVFESMVVVLVLLSLVLVLREIVGSTTHRVVRMDHATMIGFATR